MGNIFLKEATQSDLGEISSKEIRISFHKEYSILCNNWKYNYSPYSLIETNDFYLISYSPIMSFKNKKLTCTSIKLDTEIQKFPGFFFGGNKTLHRVVMETKEEKTYIVSSRDPWLKIEIKDKRNIGKNRYLQCINMDPF